MKRVMKKKRQLKKQIEEKSTTETTTESDKTDWIGYGHQMYGNADGAMQQLRNQNLATID